MSGSVYTKTARVLHWAVAALVVVLFVIGTMMVRVGFELTTTVGLYQAHKSFGVMVFALMLLRIIWRMRHVPPLLPAGIEAWRRRAASVVHGLLYLLLLALPVTGWLSASAAPIPFPFVLFGLFEVPDLVALASLPYDARSAVFEQLALTHRLLAWSLLGVISLHIWGAIWPAQHRRAVLSRMWLNSAPRTGPHTGNRTGPKAGA